MSKKKFCRKEQKHKTRSTCVFHYIVYKHTTGNDRTRQQHVNKKRRRENVIESIGRRKLIMCPERVNNPRDQPQKEALLLSSCGRPFTISSHCQLHPLNNEQDTILRVSKIEKFTWHRDLTHSEINFTRLCENHVINRSMVFGTILRRLAGFSGLLAKFLCGLRGFFCEFLCR